MLIIYIALWYNKMYFLIQKTLIIIFKSKFPMEVFQLEKKVH